MTFDEFEALVEKEPNLKQSLEHAAVGVRPSGIETRSFDPVSAAAGMAALVILFPVVNRIVQRIGLPWLKTLENYSELWRGQVEQWIDEQHKQRGFDPKTTRAASESLLKELQETTDVETRSAWQRLMDLLKKDE
ncbi:MAG: hypothetical protein GY845_04005 [Planctomycetes bacterium]|nr:hypothetical protein [Planctomycetota bacterium]